MIDSRLAANGRIDLRKQGCRHLNKRHTALVAGCRKACHIADHANAQEQEKFQKIEQISFAENKKLLRSVSLFDVYKGEKIEAGKKSYAVSFTFLDETKTLTDKDIDKVMNRLMDKFEKEIGAQIRRGWVLAI